jgi:hypothetical protein
VVPDEGIEPPTFGLQNRCSTAELIRRRIPWNPEWGNRRSLAFRASESQQGTSLPLRPLRKCRGINAKRPRACHNRPISRPSPALAHALNSVVSGNGHEPPLA